MSEICLLFKCKDSKMNKTSIRTGYVVRSIPYEEGFGKKQLAWLAYCGVVGTVLAPMCFLGGPILTRAAWYTGNVHDSFVH